MLTFLGGVIFTFRHWYHEVTVIQTWVKTNFTRQIQVYTKYCKLSTADGVCALLKHIQDTYNLDLNSVGIGSLEIKCQCPSLERIEDYRSGHLNELHCREIPCFSDEDKSVQVSNRTATLYTTQILPTGSWMHQIWEPSQNTHLVDYKKFWKHFHLVS